MSPCLVMSTIFTSSDTFPTFVYFLIPWAAFLHSVTSPFSARLIFLTTLFFRSPVLIFHHLIVFLMLCYPSLLPHSALLSISSVNLFLVFTFRLCPNQPFSFLHFSFIMLIAFLILCWHFPFRHLLCVVFFHPEIFLSFRSFFSSQNISCPRVFYLVQPFSRLISCRLFSQPASSSHASP